jgi:hypothetical protein
MFGHNLGGDEGTDAIKALESFLYGRQYNLQEWGRLKRRVMQQGKQLDVL